MRHLDLPAMAFSKFQFFLLFRAAQARPRVERPQMMIIITYERTLL